jgi:putative transposase
MRANLHPGIASRPVFQRLLPTAGASTMPRSARILLPRHIYHLTHRCHNGSFFLRFDTVRVEYRRRLWLAVRRFKIIMLNYCLTSNHIHLLLIVHRPALISSFMRHLEGEFASHYNRHRHRRGAFWSERYHATLIENGCYFWNCMRYIDLNMVRAGVVKHPADWPWCGYQEIVGLRQRYRILDLQELLRLGDLSDLSAFATRYNVELDQALKTASGRREPHWTESIAVGSEAFVQRIAALSKNRKELEIREWAEAAWYVRDPAAYHEPTADTRANVSCDMNHVLNQKNSPIFWR